MGRSRRLLWGIGMLCSAVLAGCAGDSPADPAAAGQRVHMLYCAGCHSLDATGPTTLGPSFAGLMTRAAANGEGLTAREWLTREIVEPNAVIADGFAAGLMPTTYRTDLSPQQYQDLLAFLETLR